MYVYINIYSKSTEDITQAIDIIDKQFYFLIQIREQLIDFDYFIMK